MNDLEQQVRNSLRELVDAYQPGTAAPEGATSPAPPTGARRRVVLALGVAAMIAVTVGVGAAVSRSKNNVEIAADVSSATSSASSAPGATYPANSTQPDDSAPTTTPPPTSPTSGLPEQHLPSTALLGSAAASCAFSYNDETLSERGFAFDGTVTAIAEPSEATDEDPYVNVEFTINHWFRGDGPSTVTVGMFQPPGANSTDGNSSRPQWDVGSRLLISGESQYSAGILIDPVAWFCGFSRTYDEATADSWRDVFATADNTAPTPASAAPGCVVKNTGDARRGDCTLVDWDLVDVQESQLTITYYVNDPGCSLNLDRVEVAETETTVSLRFVVGYTGDEGASCPTAYSSRTTTVDLASPLNDRDLTGCRPEDSFVPAGRYNEPEPRSDAAVCGTR